MRLGGISGSTTVGGAPGDRRTDLLTLALAVTAIASSAILVRWADAPAVVIAAWRTMLGAAVLAPWAAPPAAARTGATSRSLVIAGLAMAVHFGTWLTSLDHTTVAASVTIVTSAPLWVAAWLWLRGEPISRRSASGIVVALTGLAVIGGADLLAGADRWFGDLLALIGALAMAVYLLRATELRQTLSTAQLVTPAYGLAAATLFVVAALRGDGITELDGRTWIAIGLMVLGPQLLGHTMLSRLVKTLGPVTVSLALVAEPVGATALAWLVLDEAPTASTWVGVPLVLAGLWLHLSRPPADRPSTFGEANPDAPSGATSGEATPDGRRHG